MLSDVSALHFVLAFPNNKAWPLADQQAGLRGSKNENRQVIPCESKADLQRPRGAIGHFEIHICYL